MEDYRALLEGYPRSALADDAALALARAYLERDQPEAARKVLQRAAQLPQGRPDRPASGPGRLAPARAEGHRPEGREGRGRRPARDRDRARSRGRPRRATARPAARARLRPDRPPGQPGSRTPRVGPRPGPPLTVRRRRHARRDARVAEAGHHRERRAATGEPTRGRRPEPTRTRSPPCRTSGSPSSPRRRAPEPQHRRRRGHGARARRDGRAVRSGRRRSPPRPRAADAGPRAAPGHQASGPRARSRSPSSSASRCAGWSSIPATAATTPAPSAPTARQEKDVALGHREEAPHGAHRAGARGRPHPRDATGSSAWRSAPGWPTSPAATSSSRSTATRCPQRHIRGIETYTLNLASDRYAIRLAARENATSEKGMSDLQFLLADLATRANTEESVRLATQVQSGLVSQLRSKDAEDPRPRHQGGALLRAPRDEDAGHPGGDRLPLQRRGGEAPRLARLPGGRRPGHRRRASRSFLGNRDRLAKAN